MIELLKDLIRIVPLIGLLNLLGFVAVAQSEEAKLWTFRIEGVDYTGTIEYSFSPASQTLEQSQLPANIILSIKLKSWNNLPDSLKTDQLELILESNASNAQSIKISKIGGTDYLSYPAPKSGSLEIWIKCSVAVRQDFLIAQDFRKTYLVKQRVSPFVNESQTPEAVNTIESQIDPDEELWLVTLNKNTEKAYDNYLRQFPRGKFKGQAKKRNFALKLKRIPIQEIDTLHNANQFTLVFDHVVSTLEVSSSKDSYEKNSLDSKSQPNKHSIQLTLKSSQIYHFTFCDSGKTNEANRCITKTIDNTFSPQEYRESNDTLFFDIKGGVPPFSYRFGGEKWDTTVNQSWQIARKDFEKHFKVKGPKEVKVSSDEHGKFIVLRTPIKVKKVPDWWKNIEENKEWLWSGLLLPFLLILLMIRRANRRRKTRINREKLISQKSIPMAKHKEKASYEATSSEETNNHQETNPTHSPLITKGYVGDPKDSKEIKIKRKSPQASSNLTTRGHSFDIKPHHLPLNMQVHWKRSLLQKIYLNRSTIFELNDYVRTHNTAVIQEREGDIPEIGGMLLGTFQMTQGKYEVIVEKFVAIQSKEDNVYRLEFSIESLAQDLDTILDTHPDYTLVGWFHTHPGHGLFLSQPDLNIQHGFFKAPYQFAMEIDTLTENLDTGFFTWKAINEVNNQQDRKQGVAWFSWLDIEKFTRKQA